MSENCHLSESSQTFCTIIDSTLLVVYEGQVPCVCFSVVLKLFKN
jgi:hypothetical protein